jgi:hypothetical protein
MLKGTHHLKETRLAISYSKQGVLFTKEHSGKISKALKNKHKTLAHRKAISLGRRNGLKRNRVVCKIEKGISRMNVPLRYFLSKLKMKLTNRNESRFLRIKKTILNFVQTHKRLPHKHSSYNYAELSDWSKKERVLNYRLSYFTSKGSGYDPRFKQQLEDLRSELGIGRGI